jgi:hypothetical protein
MRITKDTPKLPKKKPEPILKWQVDDYAKCQDFRFHLPYSFLLLCKLWNTTPDDLLHDFMHNMSCGSVSREGGDQAKKFLQQYIFEMGYGQQQYSKENVEKMFAELDGIGRLWPENAKMKIIEMHARWRDEYYNWWFKKWRKRKVYRELVSGK